MSKKVEKHEHTPYPSEVFELTNYCFVIVKIECADEDCNWQTWDWGELIQQDE